MQRVTSLMGFNARRSSSVAPPPSTNLWGWWNSDNAYTDAGVTLCSVSGTDTCQQLSDLSGNSRHLVNTTAAQKPVWYSGQVNGRPAVRFDGTDDRLERTTDALNSDMSFFFLFKQITWTNNDVLFGKHDSISAGKYVIQDTSSPQLRCVGPGFNSSGLSAATWGIAQFAFNSGTNAAYIKVNNAASTFFVGTYTGDNGTGFDIGRAAAAAAFGNIDVAEALVYTGVAIADGSAAQSNVFTYLNSRGAIY